VSAIFQEAAAGPGVAAVPLSHLSLELGHLYLEDFAGGLPAVTRLLRDVAPWARAIQDNVAAATAPRSPRISTCFLVDDYFSPLSAPSEVVPMLLQAADAAGLTIDYLARESACAQARGIPVAELVAGSLVPDPPPGTNGARPPTKDTGWLCNGVRSPRATDVGQAMKTPTQWQPPSENGANRHSVFVDVELWSDGDAERDGRLWSCSFLASVWQLLRLGLLRAQGQPVVTPRPWTGDLPATWSELDPVIQLNPQARPFAAYRTYSVLAMRFLNIEHAVRTILSQVQVDHHVMAQIDKRATDENVYLPREIIDRIGYTFPPNWS
jgi:hypothetical protein